MVCDEARRLLDQGLRPGSSDPRRAALGFHLAGCPACRAYRASHDQLLAALLGAVGDALPGEAAEASPQPAPRALRAAPPTTPLFDDDAPPRAAAGALVAAELVAEPDELDEAGALSQAAPRPAPPRVRRRRRLPPALRYAVLGLLAVVALGLGLVAGRITHAALTIGGNLAAMQVTAAPTRPMATPTLALPTAPAPLAVASATPPPEAAGVFDAPPAAPATPDAGLPTEAPAGSPTPTPGAPRPVAPTPIKLPAIGGAPIPTLMPTFGVLPTSGKALNILLLGSDRRPGESWQTRSDAIIIAHLDPARQRVALLSLPRDLIVNIPGYGYSRINAATVYGDMYPELGGGSELARATVSDLLGIPIDHVVRIDFSAFMAAINAIGGIDVVVENELYDPEYPTMDYGYMVAHFLPGPQHFDGETALMYARLRHADSDYHRARRQQQVIQAAMQRVRDQNILGQIDMLADLSTALRDNIQTDLSLDQMVGIAWAFRNFAPDQVERYALDENLTSVGLPGDQYAITASPWAIGQVVAELLGE